MKNVAIFDFDNTLIEGDSFLPYLCFATGAIQTYLTVFFALIALLIRYATFRKPKDEKTYLKEILISSLLGGQKLDKLKPAAVKLREWQKINPEIMQRLNDHRANGDAIVIASGGLYLYLPELLRDIPHDALICTDIDTRNGMVTGDMIVGNCVRKRKAERVVQWLINNGPFNETYGYGNYPDDLPMLELVKYKVIVS